MPLNRIRRVSPRLSLLVLLVSGAPVLLFAYFGHYMRMMRDSYGLISQAREFDLVALVTMYRSSWRGSFGDVFLIGLFGPFDGEVVKFMPAVIIGLWLIGAFWLVALCLKLLKVESNRIAIAGVVAPLLLTASINGLYSLESLYWYDAALRYTLPLALTVFGIALSLELLLRSRTGMRQAFAALIVALVSFVVASFSEMYLVFQLSALPFLGAVAFVAGKHSHRRVALNLISIAWLATVFNGLIQLSAPGIGERAEWFVAGGVTAPIRELHQLIPVTANLTFQYVTHQSTFAGFMLMFAAGLTLSLTFSRTERRPSASSSHSIRALPLWLGLVVQFCFVPLLWAHTSDSPSILGRFSVAYFLVICLNALAILAFASLLLLRKRMSAARRPGPLSAAVFTVVLWTTAIAIFAGTQIRSIHYLAAGHMFLTALSILGLLSFAFASARSERDWRRDAALIVICFAATVISAVVLLALANYSIGYVRDRVMAPLSLLLAIAGIVWGSCMGGWLRHFLASSGRASGWLAGYKSVGLSVVAVLGFGIFFGRLQWLSDLQLYARGWDARHEFLLTMSEKGARRVEVAPLAYDMSQYFWKADISMPPENAAAERYYGIESIVQTAE